MPEALFTRALGMFSMTAILSSSGSVPGTHFSRYRICGLLHLFSQRVQTILRDLADRSGRAYRSDYTAYVVKNRGTNTAKSQLILFGVHRMALTSNLCQLQFEFPGRSDRVFVVPGQSVFPDQRVKFFLRHVSDQGLPQPRSMYVHSLANPRRNPKKAWGLDFLNQHSFATFQNSQVDCETG